MRFDLVLANVGGQGGLSIAAVVAVAARMQGLFVKQSEVHGMSQRGGAVSAHLRLSDQEVASPSIPLGAASMIVSLEPMESVRYLQYLSSQGRVVSAIAPVVNIPDYPRIEELLSKLKQLPGAVLVDADQLARVAGSARTANMVMLGAASNFLPLNSESLEAAIREIFSSKGEAVVVQNLKAFALGRGV
ncbi:indolepyruvate oxidoreductase subunit beta [Bdellovibrionota bacterium FG-2]